MATGRVNVGGGGGRLNIFTQLTEPSKKEGIWIKTNRAYKKAVVDESVYAGGEWIDRVAEGWLDLPDRHTNGSAVLVGSKIYFTVGSSDTELYSLDIPTKQYTKLADTPIPMANTPAAHIDGYIYFFSSSRGTTYDAYKYNIANNSFTQIANTPHRSDNRFNNPNQAVSHNEYIYMQLGYNDYRYNTNTDTYEQVTRFTGNLSSFAKIGNYIYRFGSESSSTGQRRRVRRYSIANNTVDELPDMPYSFQSGQAVAVGSDIYLIGGDQTASLRKNFYKYDTSTQSYEKLEDIPRDFYGGSSVTDGILIFSLGGNAPISNYTDLSIYSMMSKSYQNDDIIIVRTDDNTGAYKTELSSALPTLQGDKFTRLTTGFDDVYMYYDNDLHSLEAYYGNGEQWIKFKEAE